MAWLVNEYLQTASQNRVVLETAETVADGLQRLAQGDIQVLLLDLSLPDSLGPETFTKIHRVFPDIPVVVFTSMEDEELGSRLVQLGAQDYLVKGQINGFTLSRTLRHAVERKQIERERDKLILELQQALAEVKKLAACCPSAPAAKNPGRSRVLASGRAIHRRPFRGPVFPWRLRGLHAEIISRAGRRGHRQGQRPEAGWMTQPGRRGETPRRSSGWLPRGIFPGLGQRWGRRACPKPRF